MDLRHYFSASTSKQSSVPTTSSSSNSEDDEQLSSDSVSLEPPPKKNFPAQLTTERSRSTELSWAGSENTTRSGTNIFLGWNMMRITKEHSVKFVIRGINILLRRQVEHGLRSPSKIGKKL